MYQAFHKEIAEYAVEHQRLECCPEYNASRMTWVKTNFLWTMFRRGCVSKPRQQHGSPSGSRGVLSTSSWSSSVTRDHWRALCARSACSGTRREQTLIALGSAAGAAGSLFFHLARRYYPDLRHLSLRPRAGVWPTLVTSNSSISASMDSQPRLSLRNMSKHTSSLHDQSPDLVSSTSPCAWLHQAMEIASGTSRG